MAEQTGSLLALLREMEKQGIGEEDERRHKIYGKALNQKARAAGLPQMGVFELTPLCNLSCKMCYVHLNKKQIEGQPLLSGKQWIQIMEQAVQNGMMHAQLTGGEALMHPDFDMIYQYLYSQGIQITVMTNGILLNKSRIAFFEQYPPSSIQITIYGGSEKSYERVTGYRMFQKVTENVVHAKVIDCRIALSATPSRFFGATDLKEVLTFAKQNELKINVNQNLNQPREETNRELNDFDFSEEEYMEIMDIVVPEAVRKANRQKIKELPPVGTGTTSQFGLRCAAGKALFCINWKGNMQTCLDIPAGEAVLEVGFIEAWNRAHAKALAYEIPMECHDCIYQKVCNLCPVIHAQGAPKGHVDRRICARTKCLVEQGHRTLE